MPEESSVGGREKGPGRDKFHVRRRCCSEQPWGLARWPCREILSRDGRARGPWRPGVPWSGTGQRIIFLLMSGGPSQVDTFDRKPLLDRDHGKPLPFASHGSSSTRPRTCCARRGIPATRREWSVGQRLFPRLATRVDDLCMVPFPLWHQPGPRWCHDEIAYRDRPVHQAEYRVLAQLRAGDRERESARFRDICPTLAFGGVNNWSSSFLPAVHNGTAIGDASVPSAGLA
ncbi:MAG: hypothetical protein Ct9H300mP1_34090 [Planctomycetaceae bacterium]|nr:MAG: hypothetical protein Ct9H300mP1_34090 [Planctomycetaceae bacterium]